MTRTFLRPAARSGLFTGASAVRVPIVKVPSELGP